MTGGNDGGIARRQFLRLGAAALVMAPGPLWARTSPAPERKLGLHNLHTGERLDTVYWAEGAYVPESLDAIDHVLRDFRTGDVHAIDPKLLDLLHTLHGKFDTKRPFDVISGYRSPKTNAKLAARSGGVAKHSYHMKGMAIDISLPGSDLRMLRRAALAMKRGGVGYYPNPGFVHVDVGPVRRW